MKRFKILLLVFISIQCYAGWAQIKLPRLISDGLILQRDAEIKLWGWASANEKIKLTFKDQVYEVQADAVGNWQINLPKQSAGGPYEMVFEASNTIKIKDILFGDVWVCSGQSNMELSMERLKEKYGEVISNSKNNEIRQFIVPDTYNFKSEQKDLESGNWVAANPETVLEFSGVAYFFAKKIYQKEHVPIGLINSALGGSPVESWMSEEALKPFPKIYAEAQKYKNDQLISEIEASDKKRSDDWYALLNSIDKGVTNKNQLWSQTNFNDAAWSTMALPGFWKDQSIGNVNGVVWFRKEIQVPESMVGKPAKLMMGRIVDQDFVYVNGEMVGTTGYQYPPRRYDIKPGILKAGKNTIAVRVINNIGSGGFVLDKPYYLAVANDTLNLKGEWKYKLGATMQPLQGPTFIRWKPTGLYNAMIAPLLNLKIKGVIWYQGESNTGNPYEYSHLFPAMINNWRDKWGQGSFPFFYVQLPNFMEPFPEPRKSNWAALRQAQLETLSVPNTAMAVAIDLGEWNDIHPLNKEDVGNRLALLARKLTYGESKLNALSPLTLNAKFKSKKVIICFKNVGSGLIVKNGTELKSFAVSNDGKNFVWAKAKIVGNTVVVSNKTINNLVVVRYAWDNNPVDANLFSMEGLPASPFEIKKE